MPAYFLAQLMIHDPDVYNQYLAGTDTVLRKYEGEVLAVDENPVVLEGEQQHPRVVLIRFRDSRAARRWYDSPEYQAIIGFRHQAATGTALIIEGRG